MGSAGGHADAAQLMDLTFLSGERGAVGQGINLSVLHRITEVEGKCVVDALVLLLVLHLLLLVTATVISIVTTTVLLSILICGTIVLLFSSTFQFLAIQEGLTGDVAVNDVVECLPRLFPYQDDLHLTSLP